MATSTCEGSTDPVEQAEPLDAATPARSRCISSASLSAPPTDTLSTCGAPSAPSPFTDEIPHRRPGAARPAGSRSATQTRRLLGLLPAASRAARPSATAPATFSVPGRMPYCWPPPWMIASTALRSRTMRAPMPLGAPILWPESVSRVQGRSATDTRQLAERLHRVGVEDHAGRRGSGRAISATGWITPTSLFTHMIETSAGRSASAASRASRLTCPRRSTGRTTSRPPR